MAKRLKLHNDPKVSIELPLVGRPGDTITFQSVPITMQVEEDLADLAKEIEDVETNPDSRPSDEIEALVRQLDLLLNRGDAPTDDKPEEPSAVLLEGYMANDERFTGPLVRKLVQDVIRASRPT